MTLDMGADGDRRLGQGMNPPSGDSKSRPALWTPSFTLLTLANFGVSMSFFLLMSTMASYAVAAFAASNTQAGLVNSVFILGAMAARVVAGRAIELKGYKLVLLAAVVAHFVVVLSYLLASTLVLTILTRTIHGVAFGIGQTALAGAVMAKVPAQRRGEGSGWFTTGMSIATGLAPFAGLMLYNSTWGQVGVFALTATMSGLAMLLSMVAVRYLDVESAGGPNAEQSSRTGQKIRPRPLNLDGFLDARAFPIASVVALAAFAFAAALTFLDAFAKQAHLEAAAQWYFVVYAAVILVSRPVAGIIQDHFGDDVVIIPLVLSVVAGITITALAQNGFTLLLGGALLGLGYGTIVSAGQAIAVSKVGAMRAGLAVSSYFLLVDAGTGAAPVILGALVDPLGYRRMMLVAAVIALVALALYVLQRTRAKTR